MPLHIADSGFAALGALSSCPAPGGDLPDVGVMCSELLQRFSEVSDGRRDQGRVHPVALCAAAVVAGMRSFTAIAGWAADVPVELLTQLYGQCAQAPSKATIWRVVTGADAAAVDAVIGAWLARQSAAHESDTDPSALVAIAVDGKTVRGATDIDDNQVRVAGPTGAKTTPELDGGAPCAVGSRVRPAVVVVLTAWGVWCRPAMCSRVRSWPGCGGSPSSPVRS